MYKADPLPKANNFIYKRTAKAAGLIHHFGLIDAIPMGKAEMQEGGN